MCLYWYTCPAKWSKFRAVRLTMLPDAVLIQDAEFACRVLMTSPATADSLLNPHSVSTSSLLSVASLWTNSCSTNTFRLYHFLQTNFIYLNVFPIGYIWKQVVFVNILQIKSLNNQCLSTNNNCICSLIEFIITCPYRHYFICSVRLENWHRLLIVKFFFLIFYNLIFNGFTLIQI